MSLRIVFMGTPSFAVKALSALVKSSHQVVAVVTSQDKPAGRGKQLRSSAVKQYAQSEHLPLLQPNNLKDLAFVEALKALKADVFIVVAFRMLPKVVWRIPSKGTFNLHASLLPNLRGAAPINWAIINGIKTSGVTTFMIDEDIDTGHLLLQKKYTLKEDETAGSLHDELADLGSELIVETLFAIENEIVPIPQTLSGNELSAPKLTRLNTRIDWNQPMDSIEAFIRGLCPYPSAWTEIHEDNKHNMLKIFQIKTEQKKHNLPPSQLLIDANRLIVVHPEGFIHLLDVQLPNKRRMLARDLLNGWRCSSHAKVK